MGNKPRIIGKKTPREFAINDVVIADNGNVCLVMSLPTPTPDGGLEVLLKDLDSGKTQKPPIPRSDVNKKYSVVG